MDISSTNPSIDSTDPNWNLFLHQLQAENQRQKFTEQVRELYDYLFLLFHSLFCYTYTFSTLYPKLFSFHSHKF